MKKRLLLLTAVLTACANFMFAAWDDKTVQDGNGNAFVYNPTDDRDPSSTEGQTTNPASPSITPNVGSYQLTLNSNQTTTISDRHIVYNVRLINISENPGTIGTFTVSFQSNTTVYNVVVNENDFVTEEGPDPKIITCYDIKTTDEAKAAYSRYVVACQRAVVINSALVVKGGDILGNVDKDADGIDINENLYYMVSGKNTNKKYYPILNVNGEYAEGTVYTNSDITYIPVAIADKYNSYEVDGNDKVGYVHGAVDDAKVEEILANNNYKYLNFDFSDVYFVGAIATDIDDNRLAYFPANTNVSGQNIVVGTTCSSYAISENGQEIYVKTSFSAEEATYKRTFSPDVYGTIVLPFTVNNTGNVFAMKAKLTNYVASENKLTFTTADLITPNTPYLFKTLNTISGESTFYGQVNGTIEATAVAMSPKYDGAQFVGTFEGLPAEETKDIYVVGMVGSVGKIGRTSKALKPGRCYFTRENNLNASAFNPSVEIIDEDGSTTAIDSVAAGEVVSVQYVSADGQVSSQPVKGLNIVKKTFKDGSVKTSKVVF